MLIDSKKLKSEICGRCIDWEKCDQCKIMESIDAQPVCKIVYCKDCKHRDYTGRCELLDYIRMKDDFFCKDGERI